jgi:two-component system OmpR family response regulator
MTTSNSKRILLADDDLELRSMLGLTLTDIGYQVRHAVNGNDAITQHRRAPFDLVIAELGLNGFEALLEMHRHSSSTKFIATSNTTRLPVELCHRMGEHLGAHCFLAKPFSSEQLLAAVQSALE